MSEEEKERIVWGYRQHGSYWLADELFRSEQEIKKLKEQLEIYEVASSTGFDKLSKKDQKEVLDLIKFKNQLKMQEIKGSDNSD